LLFCIICACLHLNKWNNKQKLFVFTVSVRGECYYVVNVITWWMLLRGECYYVVNVITWWMLLRDECYYVMNVITWWMLLRDECYVRKASCALLLLLLPNTDRLQQIEDSVNWKFTIWFQSLCRYLRLWTINSPRVSSVQ
jgi:hypothetical protein